MTRNQKHMIMYTFIRKILPAVIFTIFAVVFVSFLIFGMFIFEPEPNHKQLLLQEKERMTQAHILSRKGYLIRRYNDGNLICAERAYKPNHTEHYHTHYQSYCREAHINWPSLENWPSNADKKEVHERMIKEIDSLVSRLEQNPWNYE